MITRRVRDSRDVMVIWVISIIKNSRDIRGIGITRRIRDVSDITIIKNIQVIRTIGYTRVIGGIIGITDITDIQVIMDIRDITRNIGQIRFLGNSGILR